MGFIFLKVQKLITYKNIGMTVTYLTNKKASLWGEAFFNSKKLTVAP